MKKLIIICEGNTEFQFCRDVLKPYFAPKDIDVEFRLIAKSAGGIVKWDFLKSDIENYLTAESDVYVTTFIDLYGIQSHHKFPQFNTKAANNQEIVANMETGMKNDVNKALAIRFIPYIQLHEFESLVFCSLDVLKTKFMPNEADFAELEKIINYYVTPEDINNSPVTAPSKRLEKNISVYSKKLCSVSITKDIGMNEMKNKCPHFRSWIEQLEKILNYTSK